MAVFALWSAPRARSTALFRSMAGRGDLVVVHEPFSSLLNFGETDVDGRPFASYHALYPAMSIGAVGLEHLHELHTAVAVAGGHHPVVIDSDDLMAHPAATLAACCAAVGLPFVAEALTWAPGERSEWRRTTRWHAEVSASSGFERRTRTYTHTVETSPELARCAAHHRPFYEHLHARRLAVLTGDPSTDH